ncbi:MAG: hypothetical protein WAK17_29030 [Candidatus Nitrosopolaris sp.]
MSNEALLSNIIPFAGSGLLGYAMGFALKKILKWMLIIIGFLAGMFLVGIQLLQKYGYVSAVNGIIYPKRYGFWNDHFLILKSRKCESIYRNGTICLFPEPWQPLHSSQLS